MENKVSIISFPDCYDGFLKLIKIASDYYLLLKRTPKERNLKGQNSEFSCPRNGFVLFFCYIIYLFL